MNDMDDERLWRAADVAYGVFYPNRNPAITGEDRAWRGEPSKNPLLRPLIAALESLDAGCIVASSESNSR